MFLLSSLFFFLSKYSKRGGFLIQRIAFFLFCFFAFVVLVVLFRTRASERCTFRFVVVCYKQKYGVIIVFFFFLRLCLDLQNMAMAMV